MTATTIPAEWTGESIVAVIIVPLLAAAFAVGAWLFYRAYRRSRDDFDRPVFLGGAVACTVGVVVSAAGLWWGMYPWKAEYHQWQAVSGVVATIDSRLVPAGENSMEDKYVVTFQGDGQQYGVLDTRAATVRPGDQLTITCVRRWQWSGTHGYDCNFVYFVQGGARS